tara:strand:+ start:278 stop:547 length:270 start_codon:yes stop_codon:yes gene_type:complete
MVGTLCAADKPFESLTARPEVELGAELVTHKPEAAARIDQTLGRLTRGVAHRADDLVDDLDGDLGVIAWAAGELPEAVQRPLSRLGGAQ